MQQAVFDQYISPPSSPESVQVIPTFIENDHIDLHNYLATVNSTTDVAAFTFELDECPEMLSLVEEILSAPNSPVSSSGYESEPRTSLKMKITSQKRRGRRVAASISPVAVPTLKSKAKSESKPEIVAKRDSHNVSERQRRLDLKTSFEALRRNIPALIDSPRVHTGLILKCAIEYIQQLECEEQKLSEAKAALLTSI